MSENNELSFFDIPPPHELNRQSGRTTRTVQAAIAALEQGKPVYLVLDNELQSKTLHLKHENLHLVGVAFADDLNIDFKTMEVENFEHDAIVFFDHSVIERRFHKTLKALHQFDNVEVFNYLVSVKVMTDNGPVDKHYGVPAPVYAYIRQLENYINYPDHSKLKILYPERFNGKSGNPIEQDTKRS